MADESRRRRLLSVAMPLTAIPGLLPRRTHNPDFEVSPPDLASAVSDMRAEPVRLERPVLVLSGWRSPALVSLAMAERLAVMTSGRSEDFFPLAYPLSGDIREIVRRVANETASKYPGESSERTAEVDVVAHSMGGLVARAGACGMIQGAPRLRIARLFTLGTPHRGAKLARAIAPDAAAKAMRPGSSFLAELDERLADAEFELTCYAHLNDRWVGATHCAPPGMEPIWTAGTRAFSHFSVTEDRRILADIARRLRGETPLAQGPSKPPRD